MVRQVKLRNRNYWAWFAKEPVGNKHGHWSEYVMHATAIACNVTRRKSCESPSTLKK